MDGVSLIARERSRQLAGEGYSSEHDDAHEHGELADAGACYALHAGSGGPSHEGERPYKPLNWPWAREEWKPTADRLRDLTKAGALIAAEIDRELRSGAAVQ